MFYIVTTSMILSSSRMGILMMACMFFTPTLYKLMKEIALVFIKRRIDVKHIKYAGVIFAVVFFIGKVVPLGETFDEYQFLLSGTGIGGTASHSVDDRVTSMERTLEVFYESPIIGSSLGGVAEKISIATNQNGDFKDNEGSAVALEVLAASGLIGMIPFLVYFYKLIKASIETMTCDDGIGKGLLVALIAEILILQLNQNILRPYFWMHIAVLSVYLRWRREGRKNVPCE